MRKHYKIVSTPRFITFLVICALVIIYATAAVTGASDVQGLTEQKYTTVAVCEGDTLWGIAREYGAPRTADGAADRWEKQLRPHRDRAGAALVNILHVRRRAHGLFLPRRRA